MKHLDLFSGIGGFALAARWMNWQTTQFVEKDTFCQKVIRKHFPGIPIHDDIKTFEGSKYNGTVDILTGGFPCQPFSIAGNRTGKDDNRFLWPEMLRVIRDSKPRWVLAENVPGILSIESGMVFKQVLTDLENEGYITQTFIIPACGVNAIHRRDRVWIIAYNHGIRSGCRSANSDFKKEEKAIWSNLFKPVNRYGKVGITSDSNKFNDDLSGFCSSELSQQQKTELFRDRTDTNSSEQGLQNGGRSQVADTGEKERESKRLCSLSEQLQTTTYTGRITDEIQTSGEQSGFQRVGSLGDKRNVTNPDFQGLEVGQSESGNNGKECQTAERDNRNWDGWPTESPICLPNDGVSSGLDRPKRYGRTEQLRALGNAVYPGLVYQLFRAIAEVDFTNKNNINLLSSECSGHCGT